MHFPPGRCHAALPPAARTRRVRQASRRHFPRPLALNQPAQTLAQGVRRQLDLVIVRSSTPLLESLQLRRHRRRFLQQKFQLLLQSILLRIHATFLLIAQNLPLVLQTPHTLPHQMPILLLTFHSLSGPLQKLTCTLKLAAKSTSLSRSPTRLYYPRGGASSRNRKGEQFRGALS